jgi:hypothetical protein
MKYRDNCDSHFHFDYSGSGADFGVVLRDIRRNIRLRSNWAAVFR